MTADKLYREAEPYEELLGIFLNNTSLLKDYRSKLTADMFQDYRWLYKLMIEIDLQEGLTFKGLGKRCSVEQIQLLHELKSTYITDNRIPILIKQIKQTYLHHRILKMTHKIQLSSVPERADETLRELQKNAYELFTTDTDDLQDMNKEVDAFTSWVEEIIDDPTKALGLMTGLSEMDRITTGWHAGDLIVIGARTSMGKSAFMIENILRMHSRGIKCAIFSLEMSKRQIFLRMMANILKVKFNLLKTGKLPKKDINTFKAYVESLKGIYVDDSRGVDTEYIADMMRRLKRTRGLDFVAVDYLQDVKEKGEGNDNSGSALGRICRKLRTAAKECDVPIMALSQIVRAVEDRQNKRPGNADLSGSTGIETSADVIGLLYMDEYYNPNTDKKGILELRFTKQRNGELGTVEFHYDKERQRIESLV